MYNRFFVIA